MSMKNVPIAWHTIVEQIEFQLFFSLMNYTFKFSNRSLQLINQNLELENRKVKPMPLLILKESDKVAS